MATSPSTSTATGSNNLRTSTNYGWTWILNAMKIGGKITTLNDATDDAIRSQKDAFSQSSIAYYVLNFLATFNSTISVPDLNQALYQTEIGVPAPNMTGPDCEISYNLTIPGPSTAFLFKRTDPQIWKLVLFVFQIIKGKNYIPRDYEFDLIWTYFKTYISSFTIGDVYNYTIAYLKSPSLNKADASLFLTNPSSVVYTLQLNTTETTYITAYTGMDYMMDETLPAFTITRRLTLDSTGQVCGASFSLKLQILAFSNASDISVSNLGYLQSATPFQYIMQAEANDVLVGSVITVEGEPYVAQSLASNMGSDLVNVLFAHVAYDSINNYLNLGFRVTAVEKISLVGNSLLLVLTVVDTPTRNNAPTLLKTLSYVDPNVTPANNASTPSVVCACWDPALQINMTTMLSNIYTTPY